MTSIHVGAGQANALAITSSLDRSCKIWSLAQGEHHCSSLAMGSKCWTRHSSCRSHYQSFHYSSLISRVGGAAHAGWFTAASLSFPQLTAKLPLQFSSCKQLVGQPALPVTCLLQCTATVLCSSYFSLSNLHAAPCLCSGTLLRSLTFPSAIHSIRTDPGDHALYAGSGDGRIFETSLVGEVTSIEGSDEQREAGYYTMEGLNGAVTCLAMTTDANQMVSGGHLIIYSAAYPLCL